MISLFDGYNGLADILANGVPAAIVSEAYTALQGAIGGTLAVLGVRSYLR